MPFEEVDLGVSQSGSGPRYHAYLSSSTPALLLVRGKSSEGPAARRRLDPVERERPFARRAPGSYRQCLGVSPPGFLDRVRTPNPFPSVAVPGRLPLAICG
jgi:hypothetical protein